MDKYELNMVYFAQEGKSVDCARDGTPFLKWIAKNSYIPFFFFFLPGVERGSPGMRDGDLTWLVII